MVWMILGREHLASGNSETADYFIWLVIRPMQAAVHAVYQRVSFGEPGPTEDDVMAAGVADE